MIFFSNTVEFLSQVSSVPELDQKALFLEGKVSLCFIGLRARPIPINVQTSFIYQHDVCGTGVLHSGLSVLVAENPNC